jgi:hypothetical protein
MCLDAVVHARGLRHETVAVGAILTTALSRPGRGQFAVLGVDRVT